MGVFSKRLFLWTNFVSCYSPPRWGNKVIFRVPMLSYLVPLVKGTFIRYALSSAETFVTMAEAFAYLAEAL